MSLYRPGPVGAEVLAVLAEADGLTVTALTAAMGRPPEGRQAVDQAIRVLDWNGCVRVLTRIRGAGVPAAVWGLTTTGRAVLAQSREDATP